MVQTEPASQSAVHWDELGTSTSAPAMSKKLTLRLDEDVIERAKNYAADRGTSVSQLVEQYFSALTSDEPDAPDQEEWTEELSPLTRRLLGCLGGGDVDEEDYYRYLEKKHQ